MFQQAARIRQARRVAGLSQAALAAHLGLDRRAVSNWERADASGTTPEQLAGIALATGIALDWLATGRGPRMVGGDGRATPAIAVDCAARSEREERLLVAFRSLSARARLPMVELLEARARAR